MHLLTPGNFYVPVVCSGSFDSNTTPPLFVTALKLKSARKKSGSRVKSLFLELLRGKSIQRALLTHEVSSIRLEGKGIDLGAKDGFSAQYRHMDMTAADITFTDINPKHDGVMTLDVESRFPIESDSYDFVLSFFLLEHVFDTAMVLGEAARITRPGGQIIGAVPQIERYHPDPDDYLRFTSSGIRRYLSDAGYVNIEIIPIGAGPMSVAAQMVCNVLKLRLLTVPIGMFGFVADQFVDAFAQSSLSHMYAFSHLFIAEQPG